MKHDDRLCVGLDVAQVHPFVNNNNNIAFAVIDQSFYDDGAVIRLRHDTVIIVSTRK